MIRISEIRFDERTRLVLSSGRELQPLEDPMLLDAGWFVPCAMGFEGCDGNEDEFTFALAEIMMIRGAQFEETKRR